MAGTEFALNAAEAGYHGNLFSFILLSYISCCLLPLEDLGTTAGRVCLGVGAAGLFFLLSRCVGPRVFTCALKGHESWHQRAFGAFETENMLALRVRSMRWFFSRPSASLGSLVHPSPALPKNCSQLFSPPMIQWTEQKEGGVEFSHPDGPGRPMNLRTVNRQEKMATKSSNAGC